MLSETPSPAVSWRGCTVPGEGWSPAETEHFGEARRRCRTAVWCPARRPSPFATERTGTRTECVGRAGGACRYRGGRVERDAFQRRALARQVGALPRSHRHHDHVGGTAHHDIDGTVHHHVDGTGDDDHGRTGDDHHGCTGDDHYGCTGPGARAHGRWELRLRRGHLLRVVLPGQRLCQPVASQGNGAHGDGGDRHRRLHRRRSGGRQSRAGGRPFTRAVRTAGTHKPRRD